MINFDNLELDNLESDEKNGELSEAASQDVPQVSLVNSSQDSVEKSSVEKKPEEIDPKTQKYLYIKPVVQDFKIRLKKTIDELVSIRLDIFNKKVEIVTKQNLIKEKITLLSESKKVRIDKAEFERSEKSAHSYTHLLDGIINELSGEIAYYNVFLSDEIPPLDKIPVPLQAPDKIEDYLELQMNGVKRYLKNVKRDITISFSRYTFGFDEQLKHLTYVESYIKSKETPVQAPKVEEK
ncbi:MAG: hypothetical protein V1646_04785 [bacterium]